jgi:hypothetical protein
MARQVEDPDCPRLGRVEDRRDGCSNAPTWRRNRSLGRGRSAGDSVRGSRTRCGEPDRSILRQRGSGNAVYTAPRMRRGSQPSALQRLPNSVIAVGDGMTRATRPGLAGKGRGGVALATVGRPRAETLRATDHGNGTRSFGMGWSGAAIRSATS